MTVAVGPQQSCAAVGDVLFGTGITMGFSEVHKEKNSDNGDFAALKCSCLEIL